MIDDYYPKRKKEDGQSADGNEKPGEYRYTRPEHGKTVFTDAGYIPREQAPVTPRSFGETAERPKKRKRGISTAGVIALCLVCVLLGTAVGLGFGWTDLFGSNGGSPDGNRAPYSDTAAQTSAPKATPTPMLTPIANPGEVLSASSIYDLACSQVVGITTEITYTNVFGLTSNGAVTGSGFILTQDGYILTNYHVIQYAVEGGYKVSVMLYDGTAYTAEIVGYEKDDNDIAVLKIDAEGLSPVTLGDSDNMQVGETVYAVGNPLGELAYTMTKGMVSALDRDITSTDSETGLSSTVNMFQIDAAVNSGNSGGPVYNERGEVIGVVTAKYGNTGVEGLGFAIPISDAIGISNDLIDKGYVGGKPDMGISVQTVSSAAAQYYNMVEGAYVYTLDSEGCAAKAGLQMGDIITKLGDEEIKSSSDLVGAKKDYKAGDSAVLTVYRNGGYLELTIVFDEEKPQEKTETGEQPGAAAGNGSSYGYIH
jgi:serine protease Do